MRGRGRKDSVPDPTPAFKFRMASNESDSGSLSSSEGNESDDDSSASDSSDSLSSSESKDRRIAVPRRSIPPEATCIDHPYANDPYEALGEELARAASKIHTKLIDSTIDCKAIALCCAIMSTMYRFLSAVSMKVLFGHRDGEARVIAGLTSRRPFPTGAQINAVKAKLISVMIEHGKMFSHRTVISGKDCCPLDNLISLVLVSDAMAFYSDRKKVDALEAYVAEDVDWIVDNNLAIDTRIRLADGSLHEETTPVLSYRMSQFLGALKQVSNRWRAVRWDEQLGVLVDLLRVRAGIFLLCSFNNVVHDMPDLCDGGASPTNPKGEYQANGIFLGTVADVFMDMIHDVACFSGYRRLAAPQIAACGASCDDLQEWLQLKGCIVSWIERKLSSMVSTSGSTYVAKYAVALDVRPGERNAYTREFSQRLADDASIVQMYRSVNFDALCQLKKRTYIEILTEDFVKPFRLMEKDMRPRLTRQDLFEPEPPQVYLAFMEMLESHMIATYFGLQWKNFWIMEPDLVRRRKDLEAVRWPVMLQAFNHWHLYYNGLIRYDSFIKCFIAFLRVTEKCFDSKIDSWDIAPWISEITTEGGKNPQNSSMFCFSMRQRQESSRSDGGRSKKKKKKEASASSRETSIVPDISLLSVL